jgi:hypothetical protein
MPWEALGEEQRADGQIDLQDGRTERDIDTAPANHRSLIAAKRRAEDIGRDALGAEPIYERLQRMWRILLRAGQLGQPFGVMRSLNTSGRISELSLLA